MKAAISHSCHLAIPLYPEGENESYINGHLTILTIIFKNQIFTQAKSIKQYMGDRICVSND